MTPVASCRDAKQYFHVNAAASPAQDAKVGGGMTSTQSMTVSEDLLMRLCAVGDMPKRLLDALVAQAALASQGVYFAPIRHHSPACAYALKAWLKTLRPTHILIEAPTSFMSLLPELLSADSVPPVAIFAQALLHESQLSDVAVDTLVHNHTSDITSTNSPAAVRAAYFPFCEYSPEWVAMQDGAALGAELHFIDLDWASQCQLDVLHGDEAATQAKTNLMAERYLAHSQFIQALADSQHCRNHDELWSHLFEMTPTAKLIQAEHFFTDVLAWCALARLDYEEAVLLMEGTLHREYCMYREIDRILAGEHGHVLIVTGGFHTLALIEHLTATQVKKYAIAKKDVHYQEEAWLIRYSYDRLDALSGYASGMPSPAYYQWWWRSLFDDLTANNHDAATHDSDARYINDLCHMLHSKDCYEMTPYVAYRAVMEMAAGLAILRGHYRPSRDDLLDAVQTALVKGDRDDGRHYLWRCVHHVLSGDKLGQVGRSVRSPALVAYVHTRAQALKFKLDDTAGKNRKLDVYRKKLHQQVSQFLHLLDFLAVGFAVRLSGPDFVLGTGMSLLFEEWRYAWTPSVESRLIALSEQGDRLEVLALNKLMAMQADMGTVAAEKSAQILAQACRLGLRSQLPQLQATLDKVLHQDNKLSSVVMACQQLFYLWHGRVLLNLPEAALVHSIGLAVRQSLYLCDQLYDDHAEVQEANVELLKQWYHLLCHMEDKLAMAGLVESLLAQLDVKRMMVLGLYQLLGAVDSINFLAGKLSTQALQTQIARIFAVGCPPEHAVAYLQGMFKLAPEVFVQSRLAIEALHAQVSGWSGDYFLQVLPELRFMFSQLNPKQSDSIAAVVATLTGLAEDDIGQVQMGITEAEMMTASLINQRLNDKLMHDGLMDWLTKEEE